MTVDRPICTYALASLKKNSTHLLIAICIGLALSLYGIYVQARSVNPAYKSSLNMASSWMIQAISDKFMNPAKLFYNCYAKATAKRSVPSFFSRYMIRPIIYKSGLMNAAISITQIVLLKLYCRSVRAATTIVILSALGVLISGICFFGTLASCKAICISCLSFHHGVVIYLAMRRRNMIGNMLCPPANTNEGACTFGTPGNYGGPNSKKSNPTRAANESMRRRTRGS